MLTVSNPKPSDSEQGCQPIRERRRDPEVWAGEDTNDSVPQEWYDLEQEIRSVEHGICPIAEFTSPYRIVRIVTEYRILYSADVVMYMYCIEILSEYWKVNRLFKPLPRDRNFKIF